MSKETQKDSFIHSIQESQPITRPDDKPIGTFISVKPVWFYTMLASIGLLVIALVVCGVLLSKASDYSDISRVEELINTGYYDRAEELLVDMLTYEKHLFGYAEGAFIRISGVYAAKGQHEKAKLTLEKLLSLNPDSFPARTNYIFSAALSGDGTAVLKGISEIPMISIIIPNITSVLTQYTAGKFGSATEAIEIILKLLFQK